MDSKLTQRQKIFNALPIVAKWAEMKAVFHQASKKNLHGWDLPNLGCQAVHGDASSLLEQEVALGCLQTAIILIDDMLDEEPNGYFREWGHAKTANLASAFQAAGLAVIAQLGSRPDQTARIHQAAQLLNEMVLLTAYGQMLDVENPDTEEQYWQVVHYKSTPYYRSGIALGAILAGATPDQTTTIQAFGTLYGELIQIHDDLKDTMSLTLNPDWLQNRYPLPILFAAKVDHLQRNQFEALRHQIETPGALQEAQQILIECGAVSYCLDQIIQRYQRGKNLLEENPLPNSRPFHQLLDDLIEPVRGVFRKLSIPADEQEAVIMGT